MSPVQALGADIYNMEAIFTFTGVGLLQNPSDYRGTAKRTLDRVNSICLGSSSLFPRPGLALDSAEGEGLVKNVGTRTLNRANEIKCLLGICVYKKGTSG